SWSPALVLDDVKRVRAPVFRQKPLVLSRLGALAIVQSARTTRKSSLFNLTPSAGTIFLIATIRRQPVTPLMTNVGALLFCLVTAVKIVHRKVRIPLVLDVMTIDAGKDTKQPVVATSGYVGLSVVREEKPLVAFWF